MPRGPTTLPKPTREMPPHQSSRVRAAMLALVSRPLAAAPRLAARRPRARARAARAARAPERAASAPARPPRAAAAAGGGADAARRLFEAAARRADEALALLRGAGRGGAADVDFEGRASARSFRSLARGGVHVVVVVVALSLAARGAARARERPRARAREGGRRRNRGGNVRSGRAPFRGDWHAFLTAGNRRARVEKSSCLMNPRLTE